MNPFQDRALQYLHSGLGFPIPSAYPYEKFPPLKGWTGRNGKEPDEAQVSFWIDRYPDSNILLRMAPDVIGIDVDHYDDKRGADTLRDIAQKHGRLPVTMVSTARTLPSGIYWFRLHPWMDSDAMRDPGEHIEVIRYGHRYAVAPPSWHPGARARYRWTQRGTVVPVKANLALLPTEWYVHLTRGCSCFDVERAERKMMMRRVMNRPSGEAGRKAAREDLTKASEALSHASPGSRNNMLSSIAGRFLLYDSVLNGVLDDVEIMFKLYHAGLAAGLEKHETDNTIRSARDWAIREGMNRE
ncbi:MAG: hypothetical protein DRH08_00670 [Deltaproteobacteria bacterium]|nr:MAG: hypothetical protein DRH08_00670 [Deltaproteobacteria bacterium]